MIPARYFDVPTRLAERPKFTRAEIETASAANLAQAKRWRALCRIAEAETAMDATIIGAWWLRIGWVKE